MKITIFSAVNYNNDGEPAPEIPRFENFVFRNINLTKASTKEPVININGFKEPGHRLKNLDFTNIILPENAKVMVNDAERVKFSGVKTESGKKPEYLITGSSDIRY